MEIKWSCVIWVAVPGDLGRLVVESRLGITDPKAEEATSCVIPHALHQRSPGIRFLVIANNLTDTNLGICHGFILRTNLSKMPLLELG